MKWIDIEKKMPHANTWVLIHTADGACHVGYFDSGYEKWIANSKFGDDVTHWMPLPDSPEN